MSAPLPPAPAPSPAAPAPPTDAAARVRAWLLDFQNRLCAAVETADGSARFTEENWTRPGGGGGGLTRVLAGGALIEKGGVNFSHVVGANLPPSAMQGRPELTGAPFEAMGVSLVLHPLNPHVPTTHLNLRFFAAGPADAPVWWFGGGFDLTPYYGYREDAIHWHRTARAACAPRGPLVYPRLKRACDDYFFLKHRHEPRGIGGLFFDDWREPDFDGAFAFVRDVGDHFWPAYSPIVARRRDLPTNPAERRFQNLRRGRYVEFNLVWDRGTLFGLQSGGRTESILMSLPPHVEFAHGWQAAPGSREAELTAEFLRPRDWADELP